MNKPIRRVAVLGSGVMGSGIAAHVANAGLPVLLLDIPPRDGNPDRNAIAKDALKKLGKHKPAPLFSKRHSLLIEVGNLDDDLERAAECDLIVEAIIERLDIKQSLFARLEKLIGEDTLVASNTSGLRIVDMLQGRSDTFRKNFAVMHFFNPPRYMKLLELVAGEDTSDEALERIETFGREVLGKGIVHAKDRPNFVANRIGAHSMMATIHAMLEAGLSPEDVDAITGKPMGHPKSATFRTADVVGLDTLVHVVDNCHEVLTDDEDREVFAIPDYIRGMLDKKLLGSKTKAGFYKKGKGGIETLDPKTLEYRPRGGDADIKATCKKLGKIEDLGERLRALVADEGPVGQFAWKVLSRSMAYAARRLGEISDQIEAIDAGMRWGYNWEMGPFETWDALGFAATFDRMVGEGVELPDSIRKMRDAGIESFYEDGHLYDPQIADRRTLKRDEREVTLTILRGDGGPVLANSGAEAWDLGDGVLGLTFKTKANSIDPDVIKMLHDSCERAERDFRALLIANQGEHFCVGANLFLVVMAAGQKNWDQLREMVRAMQGATQRMKYSTVPVVGVPYGMTLGGGLELCLACDEVQAAAETYSGLVEVGVGLIPGGAGNMNMLWRALEGIPDGVDYDVSAFVAQTFKNIAMAKVATSADEAKAFGYFRRADGASFDRARQLWEAKKRVLALADMGYHPPIPRAYKLPGDSGIATIEMLINTLVSGGYATEHDAVISRKLAEVLCGGRDGAAGPVTEEKMLELECEAFISLCGEPKSQARMQHMLTTNKPLRN
jgi:3-hydroxyacyl-CoA dehydrogenase